MLGQVVHYLPQLITPVLERFQDPDTKAINYLWLCTQTSNTTIAFIVTGEVHSV